MAGKSTIGYIIAVYDKFSRPLTQFNRELIKLDKGLFRSTLGMKALTGSGMGLATSLGIGGASLIAALTGAMVTNHEHLTNYRLGLEAATGSTQKANAVLKDLIKYSEKTPTSLKSLTNTTYELLQMGLSTKDAMSELKKLNELSIAYTVNLDKLTSVTRMTNVNNRISKFQLQTLGKLYKPLKKAMIEVGEEAGFSSEEMKQAFSQQRIYAYGYMKALDLLAEKGGLASKIAAQYSYTIGGSFSRLGHILKSYSEDVYTVIFGTKSLGNLIGELDDKLIKLEPKFINFIKMIEKTSLEPIERMLGIKPTLAQPALKAFHEIKVNVTTNSIGRSTTEVKTISGSPTTTFKVGKNMSHVLGRQ